jgi:hypothetical protein
MFIENNDGARTKAIAEIFEDFFCRRRDRQARKGTGVCARCGESSGGSRKLRRSPASVKIVRAFAGPMPGTVMVAGYRNYPPTRWQSVRRYARGADADPNIVRGPGGTSLRRRCRPALVLRSTRLAAAWISASSARLLTLRPTKFQACSWNSPSLKAVIEACVGKLATCCTIQTLWSERMKRSIPGK